MRTDVFDCPRCGAQKMTFDIHDAHEIGLDCTDEEYNATECAKIELAEIGEFIDPDQYPVIMRIYEAFCVCRNPSCGKSTVFVVKAMEDPSTDEPGGRVADVIEYISQKHFVAHRPPEHLPEKIKHAFEEGETCLAVECFNAAGTMFRLCVDLATQSVFAKELEEFNSKEKRDLGLRLRRLFEQKHIPPTLSELSTCIKDDGNDGAHRGTLGKADAEDLLDFTQQLLEHLCTAPKKLEIANERREKRRSGKNGA